MDGLGDNGPLGTDVISIQIKCNRPKKICLKKTDKDQEQNTIRTSLVLTELCDFQTEPPYKPFCNPPVGVIPHIFLPRLKNRKHDSG